MIPQPEQPRVTSSAWCTVAAGPPALDTEQGVAKDLGDPENETEAKFERRSKSCAAKGLLLKLRFFFCRHAVNHDWKNATRVGEASHPGPNGEAQGRQQGVAKKMSTMSRTRRPTVAWVAWVALPTCYDLSLRR